jgi:hypothetical protein
MLTGIIVAGFVLGVPFITGAYTNLDTIFSTLEERRELPKGILAKICKVESNCNENARAKTSSAAGMFQWLEKSWQQTTRLMHQGRPGCAKGCPLSLSLRFNAPVAAEVTAFSLAQTKTQIGGLIQQAGADMTVGLYMGHFLGIGGATKFFQAYIQDPRQSASPLFPKAAAANSPVFANRTLVGVYNYFAQKLGQAPAQTGIAGNFEDTSGKPLVDNPSMYPSSAFDTQATVPATDDERDYQTDYSKWTQVPNNYNSSASPSPSPSQPPTQPRPPLTNRFTEKPLLSTPVSTTSPTLSSTTARYLFGDVSTDDDNISLSPLQSIADFLSSLAESALGTSGNAPITPLSISSSLNGIANLNSGNNSSGTVVIVTEMPLHPPSTFGNQPQNATESENTSTLGILSIMMSQLNSLVESLVQLFQKRAQ